MLICDNCISNWIFNFKNVQYSTPTVNMFINKDCFFNFIENLEEILLTKNLEFEYREYSKYKNYTSNYKILYNPKYDIEFHNLHEQNSLDEVTNSFNRRLERLDFRKLVVVCHTRDNFEHRHLTRLSLVDLPKERKFLISTKKYTGLFTNICLKTDKEDLPNIYEETELYLKNKDFKKLFKLI